MLRTEFAFLRSVSAQGLKELRTIVSVIAEYRPGIMCDRIKMIVQTRIPVSKCQVQFIKL